MKKEILSTEFNGRKKCRVEEKIFVPKESFIPKPKVESSVLLFEKDEKFGDIDDEKFLEVIKKGFSEPRKKLIKNLVKGGYKKEVILQFFDENGYDENLRGEDMGVEKWCEITSLIYNTEK